MPKVIYIHTDYVSDRFSGIITPGKLYRYEPESKTAGHIINDQGKELFVRPTEHLFIDDYDWIAEEVDELPPMTKEAAREVLSTTWEAIAKHNTNEVFLDGSFTKEELQAILILWEEL